MPAATTSDPAENLGLLAQNIDGFEPNQVVDELDPVVNSGRYSLLSKTIVEFHAEQIGPVASVLESVGEAIGRVESRRDRSALSQEASKAVIGALEHQDFRADSSGSVAVVAERGRDIIGLNDNASEQIGLLRDLSRATSKADVAGPVREDMVSLFEKAASYLDEAAERASGLELGVDRVRNLGLIANDSSENYWRTAIVFNRGEDIDDQCLPRLERLRQQPLRLYEQVLAARDAAETNVQNTGRQFDTVLIKDILGSAAKIAPVEPLMYKELAELAEQEIKGALAAYESDETSTQSPAAAATHLANLGNVVATAVTDDEFPHMTEAGPGSNEFIQQVVTLFRAAEANANRIGEDDEFNLRDFGGATDNAIEAASKILFADGEAAKEILEIAYGLALKEDAGRHSSIGDASRRDVISAITDSADRLSPTRFERAFELFHLAHSYEKGWLSAKAGKDSSGMLATNARRFLENLEGKMPKMSIASEGEAAFIEYAAGVARSNNNKQEIQDLKALQHFTENDRELNEVVSSHLEAARADEAARHQPKSATELEIQKLLAS